MQHPVAREMLADASLIEGDVHWRKDLAYYSTTFAGDGFVLVGDAAGVHGSFLQSRDGLDFLYRHLRGGTDHRPAARRIAAGPIEHHNYVFSKSYHRWFEAVYQDKYEYMGEYDLMRLAFLLDLGLYYLGIVSQPFKMGIKGLQAPPFSEPLSRPVFALMRTYNRRFAQIARRRRRLNLLGKTNRAQPFSGQRFHPEPSRYPPDLSKRFSDGRMLELKEGWHTWGQGGEVASASVSASGQCSGRRSVSASCQSVGS